MSSLRTFPSCIQQVLSLLGFSGTKNSSDSKSEKNFSISLIIPLYCFSYTILQGFDLSSCSILALISLPFLIFSTNNSTNSIIIKGGLLLCALCVFLFYFAPQLIVIAPITLMVCPLVIFSCTHKSWAAFLTFAFQILLNIWFFEPKFVDTLMNVYQESLYLNYFSAFNFLCFINLYFQISFSKKAQKELDDAIIQNSTLKTQLLQAQNDLQKAQKDLELPRVDSNNHQENLLTIAHECRNPLNAVQGNLELAEAMLNDKLARQSLNLDKIEAFVHNARVCGDFLLQYLNNILDAGKVESNTIDINPVSTDLKSVLEKVWAMSCESIKRKNLEGILKLRVDVPSFLMIDSHRVIQIMINLINNAIKFTSKGKIVVVVRWKSLEERMLNTGQLTKYDSACFDASKNKLGSQSKHVAAHGKTLSMRNVQGLLQNENYELDLLKTKFERNPPTLIKKQNVTKGFLIIEVTDTGCGMSREDQAKLFLKFSQVNPDPCKRKIGTGLGLWLCQQIAHKMNGNVEVESEIGVGSTFRVKIPTEVCENPLQKSYKTIPYSISNNSEKLEDIISKKTIRAMIVDDVSYNRDIHKILLKKCECEIVCEASTGKEAVEKFKSHAGNIDLIILDLEMPEMGGLETCRQIRLYERAQNLKSTYIAIVTSGGNNITNTLNNENNTLFYDYYVTKPCPLSEFQKITGEALLKSMTRLLSSFSPNPALSKSKKRVLIVDDDGFCLEVAKNFFNSVQVDVLTALSGSEGLQVLKGSYNDIGCIILDYEMPDLNGKQTLLKMKAFWESQNRKAIPVYCTSGNTSPQFVKEAKAIGFNEVYPKPLNWKKLILTIKRDLENL